MTTSGQTVTGRRAEEIAEYVRAVREALSDLPESEREELLEDLPAHLAEVAAEDPSPLAERLGSPAEYAAEMRAAAAPGGAGPPARPAWRSRWAPLWRQGRELLDRVDARTGPLLGYERTSQFLRLLAPAWWVLRGYLAAMLVVIMLGGDRSGMGLLPRLGGSTVAGLAILAGFVAGSVWLAHRTPRLGRWPRRAVLAGSLLLLFYGFTEAADVDSSVRFGWPALAGDSYYYEDPYSDISDVYAVDADGRLLTGVRLFDQNGDPIDIGWAWCEENVEYDPVTGLPIPRYPKCPDSIPWWLRDQVERREPVETAGPTAEPTPAPTSVPTPGPSPEADATPGSGSGTPVPDPDPTTDP